MRFGQQPILEAVDVLRQRLVSSRRRSGNELAPGHARCWSGAKSRASRWRERVATETRFSRGPPSPERRAHRLL